MFEDTTFSKTPRSSHPYLCGRQDPDQKDFLAVQFPIDILSQCVFLCGPTACGKTAVSLELAQQLNAEIVALDSMTLYRGMDLGTAKPSIAERAAVPHHLIDIIDPHEEFSLADYLTTAERVCREIVARAHRPLFVGGTGLYLRGVLRGVFEGPSAQRCTCVTALGRYRLHLPGVPP